MSEFLLFGYEGLPKHIDSLTAAICKHDRPHQFRQRLFLLSPGFPIVQPPAQGSRSYSDSCAAGRLFAGFAESGSAAGTTTSATGSGLGSLHGGAAAAAAAAGARRWAAPALARIRCGATADVHPRTDRTPGEGVLPGELCVAATPVRASHTALNLPETTIKVLIPARACSSFRVCGLFYFFFLGGVGLAEAESRGKMPEIGMFISQLPYPGLSRSG